MAEDKKKIVVYADWISTFDALTDEEAGKLIKHFFNYVNDLNPQSDRLTELMFTPIKQTLKRDLQKWEEMRGKRVEAGAKGGKQKVANLASATKNVANVAVSDSVSVSVSVKEKAIPTIEEFLAYALENKPKVDTNEVRLKYQSWLVNDWSVTRNGKTNEIKNWKSTLLNTLPFFKEVTINNKSVEQLTYESVMRQMEENKQLNK